MNCVKKNYRREVINNKKKRIKKVKRANLPHKVHDKLRTEKIEELEIQNSILNLIKNKPVILTRVDRAVLLKNSQML